MGLIDSLLLFTKSAPPPPPPQLKPLFLSLVRWFRSDDPEVGLLITGGGDWSLLHGCLVFLLGMFFPGNKVNK